MRKAIILGLFLILHATSAIAQLIAHYPLDGNADDASGNGLHGTVFGAEPAVNRLGAEDAALAFDGIDDVVDVPTLGDWGDELGFSFWAYADSASSGETLTLIGSRTSGSGATPINILLNIGTDATLGWRIFSWGTSSVLFTAPGAVAFDRWVHVACDWSQLTGTMRIYLDGALAASGPIGDEPRYLAESIGLGNLNVGFDSTAAPLDGLMDDVRIHSQALTDEEISDLSADFFTDGFESGTTDRWTSTVQ